jgi:hypothetical protein
MSLINFQVLYFTASSVSTQVWYIGQFHPMGLYHPLDGVTNLKYKLLYFLTPNKKISKRKALAFNRDRCCHLALCLWFILFHYIDFCDFAVSILQLYIIFKLHLNIFEIWEFWTHSLKVKLKDEKLLSQLPICEQD